MYFNKIRQVPKKNKVTCPNDYRSVALTSVIMKCAKSLVMAHIKARHAGPTPICLSTNRSTAVTHLDKRNICVRKNFIDYSSAFNPIVTCKLKTKFRALGLNTTLCNWTLDFLTGKLQAVRIGNNPSSTLTLNTGANQGCVLSPLLYSLFTHNYMA
jgi:hypothetical protein